ncbi:MAG: zinc finger domain-containing protein, partial [Planctomycetota bacterium]
MTDYGLGWYYGAEIAARPCPECGAAPGAWCVVRRGNLDGCRWTTDPLIWPHKARTIARREPGVARVAEPRTGTGEN